MESMKFDWMRFILGHEKATEWCTRHQGQPRSSWAILYGWFKWKTPRVTVSKDTFCLLLNLKNIRRQLMCISYLSTIILESNKFVFLLSIDFDLRLRVFLVPITILHYSIWYCILSIEKYCCMFDLCKWRSIHLHEPKITKSVLVKRKKHHWRANNNWKRINNQVQSDLTTDVNVLLNIKEKGGFAPNILCPPVWLQCI